MARPESAPGLAQLLTPGASIALTPARPGRTPVTPGAPDWNSPCGKTQLAVYYCESLWQSREIDLLIWVTATSRAAILAAYGAAAEAALGIGTGGDAEAVAARLLSWLTETRRQWLIVLDDLSGPADMEGLWPAGPAGRTLVTTSQPPSLFGAQRLTAFPMTGLSRRESLSYLLGLLTDDRGQRTGAIDLADLIGGEPLALGQAGALLDSSSLSCRDYADLFTRKRDQLSAGLPAGRAARPAAAAVSWPLCVEQAARMRPSAPVQALLVLVAVLDGHWIPGTVLTAPAACQYAGDPARGPARAEDIWSCVGGLERVGLLTVDRGCAPPLVRMNPTVQAAVRLAASRDLLDRAALAASRALMQAWPSPDAGTWPADGLREGAMSVARLASDLLWRTDGYQVLFRAGQSLADAGLTMLAAAHWNHVAAASDKYLGTDHPDALDAGDHLADAFLAAGRALEALPWFRRVLADRVSRLGPAHPATAAFEAKAGRALLAGGRPDEAVALFERVVADRSRANGAADPETLDARDALAAACCAAGRTDDGIRLYQAALADRERGQGPRHAATLRAAQRLADAYLAADRIKDAISAYKRVLSGRERALGADDQDTIAARSRLASAYQSAGRMAMAVQMHEQARDDSVRVLGVDHADTLARQVLLAHAYNAVGRLGDAAAVLRETAERCDRVLSPDDPLVRTIREHLTSIAG